MKDVTQAQGDVCQCFCMLLAFSLDSGSCLCVQIWYADDASTFRSRLCLISISGLNSFIFMALILVVLLNQRSVVTVV